MTIQGNVHGGQQPVSNSMIQLYAAGSTGDGSAATPLLLQPAQTNAQGEFSFSGPLPCPSPQSTVYLVATGGNPGLVGNTNNTALAAMTLLGPCNGIGSLPSISVNEITTVASAWALAPFAKSLSQIGFGPADAVAFENAVSTANELASMTSGTVPGPLLPAGSVVNSTKLYTLANILAACINTAGGVAGDGSTCGDLLSYATPQNTTPPADTIAAAFRIASNPTQNVQAIFELLPSKPPYAPWLASPPTDWSLPILTPPPAPVASLPSGTYNPGQTITISDAASQATIVYTNDGSTPTSSSPVYTSPIVLNTGQTVQAMAILNGVDSAVSSLSYSVYPTVAVSITTSAAMLGPSQAQAFTASVVGTSSTNKGVTWNVTPAIGNITSNGIYTAPASIPALQTVTVVATSVANPSASATANITLFPILPSGLIGYWPLDEGSGTIAFDRSGNGFNGAWQGAQAGNSGYYSGNPGSYAGTFDGQTTAIGLSSAIPNVSGPFTMSVWVQQSALPAAGAYPIIFGNGAVCLYVNAGTASVWTHVNTGGVDHYLGAGTALSQWHLATVTYDGATLSLFLDGILSASDAANGNISAAGNLAIGGGGAYPGLMDGVQLYGRALSAAEVEAIYNSGREVTSAPGNVSAIAGDNTAEVSFTEPLSNGGSVINSYTITAEPGNLTSTTSQATPTIVTGLSNGIAYTFTVTATNAVGTSIPSAPSNTVIPMVATAAINWNQLHQEIDGFGASDAFTYPPLTSAQADLFFSPTAGVGLSLLRTQVPNDGSCASVGTACAGSVSDMQLASARGARIFSTPWSPPASMTSNGSTTCTAAPSPSSLLPSSYAAYASYLSNYVLSVQSTGVPLYALSIQNEPDFCAPYSGTLWTDTNLHDFVLNNLGPALAANNPSGTKIMLPESGAWSSFAGLADTTMDDPNAAAYVGILAFHGYDNATSISNPYAGSGKSFWETEVSGSPGGTSSLSLCGGCWDPSIADALLWAQVMHHDLADASVNAWNYWWLDNNVSDDNEGLVMNGVVSKRLFMMGNYAKFVRPGWIRIDATENPAPGVFLTAYKDPLGINFAIVAINTTNANIPIVLNLNGVTLAGSVAPWVTSGTYNLAQQPSVSTGADAFGAILEPSSITTFAGSVVTGP